MTNAAALSPTAPAGLEAQSRSRLEERYRDNVDLPTAWNDPLDTLVHHRSIRAFLPDALPPRDG